MLTIHKATKAFKNHLVLDSVSLSVERLKIVGLAGSSGSGKSTLLRCIQGLEHLDSGTITCQGRSGFMFQDFQLFPHMSVLENLTYAPSINKCLQKDQPQLLIQKLGLAGKEHRFPQQLSGGQKQRVALARALMMKPDLLLCDEPTSGLDVATTGDVAQLLQSIRQEGATLVVASHDLDFLVRIADDIAVLKEGRIVAFVSPAKIKDPVEHLKIYY